MSFDKAPAFLGKHEYLRLLNAIDTSQIELFHSVILKSLKVLNDGLRATITSHGETLFDTKIELLYNALKRLQALPNLYPIEPERFRNTSVTLFVFYRVLYRGVHEAFCRQNSIKGAFLEDSLILFKHFPYKIYEILGSQFWRIYEFHHILTGDLTQLKLNADIIEFIQAGIGDIENQFPTSTANPLQPATPLPNAAPASPCGALTIAPCSSGIISFTETNATPDATAPLSSAQATPIAPCSSSIISFCAPCTPSDTQDTASNVSQTPNQATVQPNNPSPVEDLLIVEFRGWVQQQLDQGHLKLNEKGVYSSKLKYGRDIFVEEKELKNYTKLYQKEPNALKALLLKTSGKSFVLTVSQSRIPVYQLSGIKTDFVEFYPQNIEEI